MEVIPSLSKFQLQAASLNKFLDEPQDLVWEHQVEATKKLRDHLLRLNDIALCVLPTGSGKSGIAVMAAYACSAKRVLVITPSLQISNQMYTDFCDERESFLVKRRIVRTEQQFKDNCRPSCNGVVKKTDEIIRYFDFELVISNAHKYGTNSRVCIEDIPRDRIDLVIVDEAHHYPAKTWEIIINHFSSCKKIFLTATPKFGDLNILQPHSITQCYEVDRRTLVDKGIIRDLEFIETPKPRATNPNEDEYIRASKAIIKKIKDTLRDHDTQDGLVFHQSMVLCQTIKDLNAVSVFVELYNEDISDEREKCEQFIGGTSKKLLQKFKRSEFRTLVICGSLLEGFNHPSVSVVGIARNIQSPITFSQFIGRSFRKINSNDPVKACIISDEHFNQRVMWDNFEQVPDDDIPDNEDEGTFDTVDDEVPYMTHILYNNQ